ncbi:PH domain-containing protein [Fredinandcohnia sp. 179-A 10B2 NHS]|uniref:PH domain-containing protein n=1 Tax=Fredinandcohnia sp. 179-A 10B2 NHS TaxID=3235176 RepID=UPI0039A08883
MSEPRRMHPVAGLLNFLKQLKELILPLVFFFFVGTGDSDLLDRIYYIGAGVIILGLLIIGVLHWYRYSYRVEEGELRIEYGVFIRKKRYIPIERIQTIDVSAGIIQRIFGLVKLQVETAGGGMQAEAVLTAIKEEEANLLRSLLTRSKNQSSEVVGEAEENKQPLISYQITSKELLVLASTSGGIGIVISGVLAFLSQFAEYLPFEKMYDTVEKYVSLSILVYLTVLIAFFLLIAWVVGILIMTLRYANFSVVKRDQELFITRGLIEKRQSTIPLSRIQAIRIGENLIRQPLGFATVYIESAGGSLDKGEDFSTVLFPLLKKKEIQGLLEHFVPDYKITTNVNKVSEKALWRYILRAVLPIVPVIILIAYLAYPWGLFSLLLLPLGILLGYHRYKDSGWKIENDQLTLQYRLFSKVTIMQHKKRIQSIDKSQSAFQKKAELSSIKSFIKSSFSGKGFQVKDLCEDDGWTIFEWFTKRKTDHVLESLDNKKEL